MSNTRAWTVEAILGALLVAACTVMPWATYTDVASGTTTDFRGGPLSAALGAVGVVSVVVAVVSIVRASKVLLRLHVATGGAAVVMSLALALGKISAANHFDQQGPSQTAYAYGAVVGILAALVITATGLVRLSTAGRSQAQTTADVPDPQAHGRDPRR